MSQKSQHPLPYSRDLHFILQLNLFTNSYRKELNNYIRRFAKPIFDMSTVNFYFKNCCFDMLQMTAT